jgi:hypothetical protein
VPPASPFADWLDRVLTHGESVLSGPPGRATDEAARSVLARAYADHALDVAGPPISFDPPTAVAAAQVLAAACWHLVGPTAGDVDLPPLGQPRSPAAHLSADLTLRFLPTVYRRAAMRSADDRLAASVGDLLRRWPLSGVLADLPGPPAGDLDFGGHPGLQLLYGERLAAHERPAWVPPGGPARERVELVYRGRGRPLPAGRSPSPARNAVESPDE